MSKSTNYTSFDVVKQELIGNNTIEASAGTGKTYSLAVLVVRLILEKQIPIEKILLVTFTETAAAELKERTVKFIRLALQETKQAGSGSDATIQQIVSACQLSQDEKVERLNKALLDIDKATMSTIHSFCQQTLNEFAFETGQIFGKELMADISTILEKEVDEYWRNNVSCYDFKLKGLKGKLVTSLQYGLSGNSFYSDIDTEGLSVENTLDKLAETNLNIEKYFSEEFRTEIINKFINREVKGARENSIPNIVGQLKTSFGAHRFFKDNSTKVYINKNFQEILNDVQAFETDMSDSIESLQTFFVSDILNSIPNVYARLEQKNALTFDQLIKSLYEKRKDERLKQFLREKYKAVFVDEFQDTDPYQYGIFQEIFQQNEDSILFFIGDPKQSIFGWRQADLATYRAARDSANMQRLVMNKNFRSSKKFISAANYFFQANENSDLDYKVVEAHENNRVGLSWKDKSKVDFPSIHVSGPLANKNQIDDCLEKTLRLLFSGEVLLNDAPVKPSNVAVLVRTGNEGGYVKNIMSKLKIPSVILREESVFSSREALDLKELLNAVLTISKSTIDRVLITPFVGCKLEELHHTVDDVMIPFFYELKTVLETEGIFVMFNKFMVEFDLVNKWKKDVTIGHQKLANMNQLVGILQQKSLQDALTPSELVLFLTSQVKEKPNKEYEQGIESDEDAAKIMTIHKSKGLEFDIVLLPYLNLFNAELTGDNFPFSTFRKKAADKEMNTYYYALSGLDGDVKISHEQQKQEENERILYVALTRAKYNAFVLVTESGVLLKPYMTALTNNSKEGIRIDSLDDIAEWGDFDVHIPVGKSEPVVKYNFPQAKFLDDNFHKLSYSFLAGSHGSHPKENNVVYEEESYDKFVFKDLQKGAHIGNLLHNIFEFIDFTDESNWLDQVQLSIQRFAPGKLTDATFVSRLLEMVKHIVYATIQLGDEKFSLHAIAREKRINELEFNFPVREAFDPIQLTQLFETEDKRQISTSYGEVKGMMNGFIDLFFEHNGKYYILDWKSNFLGDELSYYANDKLVSAMNESNYHLQYMLYALAVDKFLKTRLGSDFNFEKQFGGVIYVFLRGVRQQEKNGFFTQSVQQHELDKLTLILK